MTDEFEMKFTVFSTMLITLYISALNNLPSIDHTCSVSSVPATEPTEQGLLGRLLKERLLKLVQRPE
jgi:hypothetical protein